MLPSFQASGIRAPLAAACLCLALHSPAAEPTRGDEAQEDLESNLTKTLLGYKVGDPARYADLFAPMRTNRAALSPDGKFLAYTVRTGQEIHLHIVAIDDPEVVKTKALIYQVEHAKETLGEYYETSPVRWLCWITPTRLAFATDRGYRLAPISKPGFRKGLTGGSVMRFGDITAINADGSNARILVRPDHLREIIYMSVKNPDIRVIGLHPERNDSIIFATTNREAVSTTRKLRHHGAHVVNVLTGETTLLSEKLTKASDLTLSDRLGQARITVDRSGAKELTQPLRYQPAQEPEGAPTLAEVTGIEGFIFSPETILGERALPLGFDTTGNVLYYASNVGRDTYGIYSLDLKTKQRLPGAIESPGVDLLSPQMETFDATLYYNLQRSKQWNDWLSHSLWWSSPQLVMDRFTHELAGVRYEAATRTAAWLRPELQGVQEWLAANRPGRSADILEWDESVNRVLILEQGPADIGAFHVLDRQRSTYTQIIRRGPETEAGSIAELKPFDFKLPDGSRIEGVIALPRDSKVKKIPLVLLCPDQPWQRRGAEYLPEFEALTRMGFAVAIYNGRGVWGTGIRERQKLKGDHDVMLAADVVAVADHLAGKFEVSRRSVALFGQGFGGFTALRTLQLHPGRFRCAVTVDAWVYGSPFYDAVIQGRPMERSIFDYRRQDPTPVAKHPEIIKAPVLTIADYTNETRFFQNSNFHAAVRKSAPESELLRLSRTDDGKPRILARQWARTESFLNYVLYTFSVRLGELEILPDEAPKPKQP
jgi:dipeptidyl aminopeptidase/acylaminoacyl peptidase